MNLDGPFFTSTVPHLEFSIQFQSNSLIYDKGYSIRQHMIYSQMIFYLGSTMNTYTTCEVVSIAGGE